MLAVVVLISSFRSKKKTRIDSLYCLRATITYLETQLRAVAPEEEVTYLNPLPYSPLQ